MPRPGEPLETQSGGGFDRYDIDEAGVAQQGEVKLDLIETIAGNGDLFRPPLEKHSGAHGNRHVFQQQEHFEDQISVSSHNAPYAFR